MPRQGIVGSGTHEAIPPSVRPHVWESLFLDTSPSPCAPWSTALGKTLTANCVSMPTSASPALGSVPSATWSATARSSSFQLLSGELPYDRPGQSSMSSCGWSATARFTSITGEAGPTGSALDRACGARRSRPGLRHYHADDRPPRDDGGAHSPSRLAVRRHPAAREMSLGGN